MRTFLITCPLCDLRDCEADEGKDEMALSKSLSIWLSLFLSRPPSLSFSLSILLSLFTYLSTSLSLSLSSLWLARSIAIALAVYVQRTTVARHAAVRARTKVCVGWQHEPRVDEKAPRGSCENLNRGPSVS